MPLYTVWWAGSWREIFFAAIHCAGGDLLIALTSLTLALMLAGNDQWPEHRPNRVAVATVVLGAVYTAFSEWLNIVIRAAWAYSDLMPVLSFPGFEVGLSPLLQWLAVPLIGFWWAGRGASSRSIAAAGDPSIEH